jgi:hypothetical protein
MFTEQSAGQILARAGIQGTPVITLYKEHNHVYVLQLGDRVAYLKMFTKD